tara:strand:+ start:397 stop:693 length:297 start_codon:yes stop_codon:yes gene_type:complete
MSKVFKVTATMDVGYQLFIKAENEEDAMEKAKDVDGDYWEKTDDGHDWTMEQAWEVAEDEYGAEDVYKVEPEDEDPDEQLGKQIYSGAFMNKKVDTEK